MEDEQGTQGLGEKFWKSERISFAVNVLKDSHISNLAQDLLKILCENYPTAVPPQVLALLWQDLLNAATTTSTASSPQQTLLVLLLEWVLARFPEHVGSVVGKIGSALFLPATPFSSNSGHGAHLAYGYPNPYLLMLLQKINSFSNFRLPDGLLEKALDNITYYPDDIQLLQYQLFEGCLDFHDMYKLVEDRILSVLHGVRSTSKSVREISTAILHKFMERGGENTEFVAQYTKHFLQSRVRQESNVPFFKNSILDGGGQH